MAPRISPRRGVDFVMLSSSISAILPSYGLSDYAAANAYLDGFAAAYDDPSGTRVLAVNWDGGKLAWRSTQPRLRLWLISVKTG
jgi:hypothetical protein